LILFWAEQCSRCKLNSVDEDLKPLGSVPRGAFYCYAVARVFCKMSVTYRGETFSGYNKPKRTPNHPTKSHAVLVKQGDRIKLVRFGQQGVKGAGDSPKTEKEKARRRSYYARHNAQDSNPDKFSARYWSHRVKW
jgi:hypothetical protein